MTKPVDYKIKIISIGNLTIGGSGKTPLTIELAKNFDKPFVVLRGYGRKSRGLFVVSLDGKIRENVENSGDEAMLIAKSLQNGSVIVCENRVEGILEAKKLGAKIIFLDDAFGKSYIKKFDILIKPSPQPENNFCLPSGCYREPKIFYKKADIVLEENKDFTREVEILDATERMVLVSAISKPKRLNQYIKDLNIIEKFYFQDHHPFSKEELINILNQTNATSILATQKDLVKMESFGLPVSVIKLNIKLNKELNNKIMENLWL